MRICGELLAFLPLLPIGAVSLAALAFLLHPVSTPGVPTSEEFACPYKQRQVEPVSAPQATASKLKLYRHSSSHTAQPDCVIFISLLYPIQVSSLQAKMVPASSKSFENTKWAPFECSLGRSSFVVESFCFTCPDVESGSGCLST